MFTKRISVKALNFMPIRGATITVGNKGQSSTDSIGGATVTAPTENTLVTISHIGLGTKQYMFSKLPSNITLVPSNNQLDEVVVVAHPTKPPVTTPIPVVNVDKGTPWYIWPGVFVSLIATWKLLSANDNDNTGSNPKLGLAKPKKSKKSKKAKKKSRKPLIVNV